MASSEWPTQQLAEFVASVSPSTTEVGAARAAVERAAEVLDAEVAAIMVGGELLVAVGYAEGAEPVDELRRIRPGAPDSRLKVPGVGWCAVAAAGLAYPPGATLILARPRGLTRQETALLRGMARVAAMTMTMLSVLDHERAAREEVWRLAREQAALRRVATLVARGALPDDVFAAVAQEVGGALPDADFAMVARYDPDRSVEVVGGWSRAGGLALVGRRSVLGGQNVTTLVFERNGPARIDDHLIEGTDDLTVAIREIGMRSSAGAPISVEGRLWGVMIVASTRENALRPGTEDRLADFTELIATTIANTQARQEVSALADEQAALRRVATLVARAEPPRGVFAAVAQEAGRLLPADLTLIGRYEAGVVTGVGGWSATGKPVPTRGRVSLGGRNVTEMVYTTGRPARLDSYSGAYGDIAADARDRGISSSVGAPISVEGRLWGIMVAASIHGQPLPPNTEERLAGFTELVATAIANAEAREELRRVADEQAALRRVATLVAQGAPSAAVFGAVTEEVGRLLPADVTVLCRYDPDGYVARVSAWSGACGPIPGGGRTRLGGRDVATLVFETGRPARMDDFGDDPDPGTLGWRAAGMRSRVAAPISVAGRLWGLVVVMSTSDEPLSSDTEARLVGFAELVATAIANAQAHAELTASRARIVATADQTRRRIERDLHDGAQQRLVTLALQLRAAQAEVPPQLDRLNANLDRVAVGLSGTLDELREFARGIHPAILVNGGLGPALKTLARRSPIPVKLEIRTQERLPEQVEVAAFYVISEALANAAKHAKASDVHVQVDATDGVLRLDVRDDGVGGADPADGSGLIGLRDRVEAIGGTFSVMSRRGEGTHLLIQLPLRHFQPVRPTTKLRPVRVQSAGRWHFPDRADASESGISPARHAQCAANVSVPFRGRIGGETAAS
jgi:signal transduction histidine kinase